MHPLRITLDLKSSSKNVPTDENFQNTPPDPLLDSPSAPSPKQTSPEPTRSHATQVMCRRIDFVWPHLSLSRESPSLPIPRASGGVVCQRIKSQAAAIPVYVIGWCFETFQEEACYLILGRKMVNGGSTSYVFVAMYVHCDVKYGRQIKPKSMCSIYSTAIGN